ncbi:copper resistance CopC/CopD family protein [Allopusillimonas ginsengisoli]|uniref:copper resistance CopC/CopD family protein n=1 Tax=Allopusillimonas ginsengisoli TaxID=453575 RepID=UPI0039C30B2E
MQLHFLRHAGAPAQSMAQTLAILLCVLTILAWTRTALAHASLVSSIPVAGAVLPDAPRDMKLIFNEPVSPLVLKIIQPDGAVTDLTKTHVEPDGLTLSLPALARRGTYALSWRVVSSDGHPIGGALTFSVGAKGANVSEMTSSNPDRTLLIWLSRLGWYVGLFFGIGLAACHALNSAGRNTRPLGLWMLTLGASATLLNVGLLGIDALDMPLVGLFSIDTWRTASTTSFGLSAALALAALSCAALVWRLTSSFVQKLTASIAIILLGAALAASGHASAAPPTWLARPAVWLHAVAITLWIGSLLPLAYALSDASAVNLLKRFSILIPTVLLALVASGGVLIYLQFDTPSSLWLTAYGQVLILKLVLLAVLLALGAYNRYYLTSAVLRAELAPRLVMRRLIFVECVLAVSMLAVVAVWRFTPPPRALSATPVATTVTTHIYANAAVANVSLTPAVGTQPAVLTLQLSNSDLTPLTAQEVDVAFSNAATGIEPIVYSATRVNERTWQVTDIKLPHQKRWHIRIDTLVSDFEQISLATTLELSK